jgi:hypothetical protein
MSNSRKLALGLALLGACAAAGIIACESVPLTAAPGTSLTLIANPEFVIANGGVSVVTAILVEPAGTFVADGTEVFFFTNLGRVDASGKTRNGVARVNFISDTRSGLATVVAISGGPAATPRPSPSPTASTGKKVGAPDFAGAGESIAADENTASVVIAVGNALPTLVIVGADPQRITSPRNSRITATVFDANGNPVQNVPVAFSFQIQDPLVVPLVEETLDSGGALLYTNANGQVTDTLRTQAPFGLGQKTVAVTAVTPVATATGFVTVFVD